MTGTGKTFITLLYLINQMKVKKDNQLDTIFIVPNKELAIQIENWYNKINNNDNNNNQNYNLQVIYKDQHKEAEQEANLIKYKPNIIVSTPNRLLELIHKENTLNLNSLSRIILDEVDHLLRLPTRHASLKKQWVRETHPKPSSIILDELINKKQLNIKLLVMSATLNRGIRHYLKQRNWMKYPIYIDVNADIANSIPTTLEHMCLVVSKERVINLDTNPESHKLMLPNIEEEQENKVKKENIENNIIKVNDIQLLESIALAAHADQVKKGLVFIPHSIKVEDVIIKLNKMGINAIDLQKSFPIQSNIIETEIEDIPKLYVSNYFNARGIEVCDLSHVFILGYPGTIQDYQHMAGRVGRLMGGQNHNSSWGRVITLIPQSNANQHKMRTLYKLLNITLLDHPNIID
ncbi:P-loop containing nucleoside triphosphate hydrolase protein [Neoconidiobolus thromboides FSU 785]|nr:P-loop containing nucleoside triphosphate hydrolase protein [Neoconidiobolus thromboides FSU 785]